MGDLSSAVRDALTCINVMGDTSSKSEEDPLTNELTVAKLGEDGFPNVMEDASNIVMEDNLHEDANQDLSLHTSHSNGVMGVGDMIKLTTVSGKEIFAKKLGRLEDLIENSCDSSEASDVFPYFGTEITSKPESGFVKVDEDLRGNNGRVTRPKRKCVTEKALETIPENAKWQRLSKWKCSYDHADSDSDITVVEESDDAYKPHSSDVSDSETDEVSTEEIKMEVDGKYEQSFQTPGKENDAEKLLDRTNSGDLQAPLNNDYEESESCNDKTVAEQRDSEKENGGQKARKVSVMFANNPENRRVWDKKHCCIYCMKLFPKLPRHFQDVHPDELDVAKAFSYPKKSEERRYLLDILRNKGDFAHNTQVLEKSTGVLIPWRRPSENSRSSHDYLPCEDCLALFLKGELWKHRKTCKQSKMKDTKLTEERPRRGTHQASGAALLPVSHEAESQMRALILNTMANDEIAFVARTDNLIVRFGMKLFSKNGQEKHQHTYIKQKMREVARFLIAMRQRCRRVLSLSDCINPVLFQDVLSTVKEVCKYHSEVGVYGVPSLALKLGHSLKKCAKYLRSSALQLQDDHLKKRSEEFKELVETEWNCEISAQALATLHKNTFNKPLRLPLAQDLRKLNLYLTDVAEAQVCTVEKSPSTAEWRKLAEICLAQVVLFNRRRGGESERILLSQYLKGIEQGKGRVMQEEVAASLSPFERSLAKKLSRVEIRGKKGRKVPILLTKTHRTQIEVLNRNRDSCGISATNEYLFARAGDAKTPLRTCDVVKKFTGACKAEKPEWISSTSLRKHVATVSQLLNLKDNELDILAGFMGHDIRIHREYYRLPEDTLQLAKISKVLLQLENGNIDKYKGKSLDDIQLESDEVIGDDEMDLDTGACDEEGEDTEDPPLDVPTKGQQSKKGKPRFRSAGAKPEDAEKKERRPWTADEKSAVKRQLGKCIRLLQVPGKRACEDAIAKEAALSRRPWQQIKFCVKNIISSKKAYKEFNIVR